MVLFFFLACPLRISAAIQLDSRSDLQRLVIALWWRWVTRRVEVSSHDSFVLLFRFSNLSIMAGGCAAHEAVSNVAGGWIYLVVSVLFPAASFVLLYARRDHFPVRSSPTNWALYVIAFGLGPLLYVPNASYMLLFRVAGGRPSVATARIFCAVRFWSFEIAGVMAVAVLGLSFLQAR